MELIESGRIVNTHGIHGDLKVLSWASAPEYLLDINTFYIDKKPYEVENSRIHKGAVLIKFVGITDINTAETLKNKILYADKKDFKLEDKEYFVEDLIGLTVTDIDTKQVYGKITAVLETGANDVYEVTDESGRVRLVPAIKDCIILTDIANKIMEIRPLAGLFDL